MAILINSSRVSISWPFAEDTTKSAAIVINLYMFFIGNMVQWKSNLKLKNYTEKLWLMNQFLVRLRRQGFILKLSVDVLPFDRQVRVHRRDHEKRQHQRKHNSSYDYHAQRNTARACITQ